MYITLTRTSGASMPHHETSANTYSISSIPTEKNNLLCIHFLQNDQELHLSTPFSCSLPYRCDACRPPWRHVAAAWTTPRKPTGCRRQLYMVCSFSARNQAQSCQNQAQSLGRESHYYTLYMRGEGCNPMPPRDSLLKTTVARQTSVPICSWVSSYLSG